MSYHTSPTWHLMDPLEYEVEEIEPGLQIPMVILSSSPEEATTLPSPSPPNDYKQYQELLQKKVNDLQFLLEEVQDSHHWLLYNLQLMGPRKVMLLENEVIMEPAQSTLAYPSMLYPNI